MVPQSLQSTTAIPFMHGIQSRKPRGKLLFCHGHELSTCGRVLTAGGFINYQTLTVCLECPGDLPSTNGFISIVEFF